MPLNLKPAVNLIKELEVLTPARAAQRLLGCYLVRYENNTPLAGRIVETESYHEQDAASHSYKHRTQRTDVMFGPAGYAYVYFTYGMHYCMNVVTGKRGKGEAALIRAIEPVIGNSLMIRNRPVTSKILLTNGPAKLCQALSINTSLTGHDLKQKPLLLADGTLNKDEKIVKAIRVGISTAKEELLRFYIKDNSYVSVI